MSNLFGLECSTVPCLALVLKYRLKFQVVVLVAMELLVPAHLPVKNQEAEVAMEGLGLPESGLELVLRVRG